MRIAIAGGHGQIARQLSTLLTDGGHEPVALIRSADQEADVAAAGATPLVIDLEHCDDSELAEALTGCDAVVFAAGSGPGSTPERKLSVDRDGAILLADATVQAGIRRYVMVSSRGADTYDADSDDIFQIYLRAKSEADAAVRGNDQLDWTIVRPGSLTDDSPTGKVQAGVEVEGSIPRGDVAALIATLLATGAGIGAQFEVASGETPIAEAVAAL